MRMNDHRTTADDLIAHIRETEAKEGLKPANITKHADGRVSVQIDKTVLYSTNYSEQSFYRKEWNWIHDRDTSFDCKAHQDRLQTMLASSFPSSAPSSAIVQKSASSQPPDSVTVSEVRKRYVKLPIPYFDIPLPPFERAGTRVRDYLDLATQPAKVTLTFPANWADHDKAIRIIKSAATCSQDNHVDNHQLLPTAARRASWNPIKWILHKLSDLMPSSVARALNKILPNKLIKTSRPYEWGTRHAKYSLNPSPCNSGLIATVSSIPLELFVLFGLSKPLGLVSSIAAFLVPFFINVLRGPALIAKIDSSENHNPELKLPSLLGINTPEYRWNSESKWIYDSRPSVFFIATTTRIRKNNNPVTIEPEIIEPPEPPRPIDNPPSYLFSRSLC